MDIKREELARSQKREDLLEQQREKAAELELGEPRDQNPHGPVYINHYFDLRIEKEPGFGDYKLMLMQKLQPPASLAERVKRMLGKK